MHIELVGGALRAATMCAYQDANSHGRRAEHASHSSRRFAPTAQQAELLQRSIAILLASPRPPC
jgi:hypothetical protein